MLYLLIFVSVKRAVFRSFWETILDVSNFYRFWDKSGANYLLYTLQNSVFCVVLGYKYLVI